VLTRWHLLYRWLQLRHNSKATATVLDRRRRRKFARFLDYVTRRSPYYRRIMEERGIDPRTAVPDDLPVMTKTDLVDNFDQIVTLPGMTSRRVESFLGLSRNPNELMDGRYVVVHTSGTSGKVGYCVYTRKEWIYGWLRFSRVCPGVLPPRRTAFVGATRGHFAGATMAQSVAWLGLGISGNARLIDINRPWSEILQELNTFRPVLLSTYCSILGDLAAARERGLLRIRPKSIVCGGDPLRDEDRRRAQLAFGVPVLNLYATTETMIAGFSTPGSRQIVLCEDDLWIEVKPDHLLVTNMLNRSTPLIRYKIADILVPARAEDGPALPYPGFQKAKKIVGRNEEKLILVNEQGRADSIHPLVIVEFYCKGVAAFQVKRTSLTGFVFCVVASPGLTELDRARLKADIRQQWDQVLAAKRMRNVEYTVEFVDGLKVDPASGKFRLVDLGTVPQPRPTAARNLRVSA